MQVLTSKKSAYHVPPLTKRGCSGWYTSHSPEGIVKNNRFGDGHVWMSSNYFALNFITFLEIWYCWNNPQHIPIHITKMSERQKKKLSWCWRFIWGFFGWIVGPSTLCVFNDWPSTFLKFLWVDFHIFSIKKKKKKDERKSENRKKKSKPTLSHPRSLHWTVTWFQTPEWYHSANRCVCKG
jgi:hypothetical protein